MFRNLSAHHWNQALTGLVPGIILIVGWVAVYG